MCFLSLGFWICNVHYMSLCSSFFCRWPPQPVGFSQVPHWAAPRSASGMRTGQKREKLCAKTKCETNVKINQIYVPAWSMVVSNSIRAVVLLRPRRPPKAVEARSWRFSSSRDPRHGTQSPGINLHRPHCEGRGKRHNMVHRYKQDLGRETSY